MNVSSSMVSLSGLLIAVATTLAPTEANAVTVSRALVQNAVGVCQPFLDADASQIRNRPKALQNDGTTPATVTCAFTTQGSFSEGAPGNPTSVQIFASVNDGVADTISCTAVPGYSSQALDAGVNIPAVVKTLSLPANGSEGFDGMTWTASDFGAVSKIPSGLFNVSCVLNPGVGLNDSYVSFTEEIGS